MDKEYLSRITISKGGIVDFLLFEQGTPLQQMQTYPTIKETIKSLISSIVSVGDTESFYSMADKIATEIEGRNALAVAVNENVAPINADAELPVLAETIADKSNYPYRFFNGMRFEKYTGETLPAMEVEYPITNCVRLFQLCINLKEITSFKVLGGGESMERMFFRCYELVEAPPLDTSKVTNMEYMFYDCISLKEIPYMDTSKVTNIYEAFSYCASITSFPLIDISQISDLSNLWAGCTSLESVPLLDTSNVTRFFQTFGECKSLKEIPLLDTSKATDMAYMFIRCTSLESVPLFNTAQVTDMYLMFYGCSKLTSVPKFDTSNLEYANSMFYGCTSLPEIPDLDFSQVKKIDNFLYNCGKITTIPESIGNLPNCTTMSQTFARCWNLQKLPKLITPNVTNMYFCFQYCQKLTRIEEIDFANLTNWAGIFAAATALTYMVVKNLGMSTATSYSFENATAWGTGSEENRQSVIDSLISYSYDRVAAGLDVVNIRLWSATYNLLTEEEIASITAKGYTLTSV